MRWEQAVAVNADGCVSRQPPLCKALAVAVGAMNAAVVNYDNKVCFMMFLRLL